MALCSSAVYYIEDWRRAPAGFQQFTPLGQSDLATIQVRAALNGPIESELAMPIDWWLEAVLPLATLERYSGPLGQLSGAAMTGNFYKCAERSSHPHWASWRSIGEKLDFHQPDRFGQLVFE